MIGRVSRKASNEPGVLAVVGVDGAVGVPEEARRVLQAVVEEQVLVEEAGEVTLSSEVGKGASGGTHRRNSSSNESFDAAYIFNKAVRFGHNKVRSRHAYKSTDHPLQGRFNSGPR